jgi:hypothetical protein
MIQNRFDEAHQFCKNCRKRCSFSDKIDSPDYDLQEKNYFKNEMQSTNQEKNRKVIINAGINFPNKGELEVLMDKSIHVNESISLSVVYQNFENEINGKKIIYRDFFESIFF